MVNVLITNIGRRGYLVDFLKATESFKGRVYVSDCDETASGLYSACDKSFIMPKPVDDEEYYVNKLISLCIKEKVNIIIPVIDPEIYILSKYKNLFVENKILVLVSDKNVLDICYSKLNMNSFLRGKSFLALPTYRSVEEFQKALQRSEIQFPVYIKPNWGSSSVNNHKVDSIKKLEALFLEDMVIQPFIDGIEYGIDIFNSHELEPVRVVIKKKILMRSGETDKAVTINNREILNLAKRLAVALNHLGPLDCDIIEKDGCFYIIDLNPRFGGGYPATHMAGINFFELIIDSTLKTTL